jgi:hypothetical protein
MIGLLLKYVLPLVLMYFGAKVVRDFFLGQPDKRGDSLGRSRSQDTNVIEICPDCGYEKNKRHRCRES